VIQTLGTGGWLIGGGGAVAACVGCIEQPGCANGQLVSWSLNTRESS
jgi:hypothetical protein